ncbi:hypothetical protein M0R72_14960 [Candidatus Pacearchaeota archaeon]|nr:hypothetical protein [Candidatus Pacearchaeota archaeon]
MDLITKKPMALGTVQIPVGTEISGIPDKEAKLLASRGLVSIKEEPKRAKKGESSS